MSRSVRKNPFIKICGKSDKDDRSLANRKFRHRSRIKLASGDEEHIPMDMNEVSSTWDFSSDGLAIRLRMADSNNPEDIEQTKKYMRK